MTSSLVGRTGQVQRLMGMVAGLADGHGGTVLIAGEPGMGKTAVLDALAVECTRLGSTVLRGRADQANQTRPFAAIRSCLRSVPAGPGDHRTDSTALTVAESIVEDTGTTSTGAPVALLLDDLQWADSSSVLVLHRLTRVLGRRAVLFATTRSTAVVREDLDETIWRLRSHGADLLTLQPLADSEVAELIRRLTGATPGPRLLQRLAGAAGNPASIIDAVQALIDAGDTRTAHGTIELIAGTQVDLSWVRARRSLALLDASTRAVLQVAALLGPRFRMDELSAAVRRPATTLADDVMRAVETGLLAGDGDHLVFCHEVVRTALESEVPAATRTAMHVDAFRMLVSTSAHVERVAQHLVAAGKLDGPALAWAVESAAALIARAPNLAVDLLRLALSELGECDERAGLLKLRLAQALLRSGRPVEADREALTAIMPAAADGLPRAGGASTSSLLWVHARALLAQGEVTSALAAARTAIASGRLSADEKPLFHAFGAACLMRLGRLNEADKLAGRAIAIAGGFGHQREAAHGLAVRSGIRLHQLRFREALGLAERAVREAAGEDGTTVDAGLPGEGHMPTPPDLVHGISLYELDRDAEASDILAKGLRNAEGTGTENLPAYHLALARLRFLQGRWDEALRHVEAGSASPASVCDVSALRGLASLIHLHRGDRAASLIGVSDEHVDRWSAGLRLEAAGNRHQALDLLGRYGDDGRSEADQMTLWLPALPRVAPDVARLASSLGRAAALAPFASTVEELAIRESCASLRATAALCRGVADASIGQVLAAADGYLQADRPLYRAYAFEIAAIVAARRGSSDEARRLAGAAIEIYQGLGAVWDASRVGNRMRSAGLRVRAPSSRGRRETGWSSLSASQHQLVVHVAQGLSNAEIADRMFLSRRTVEWHVSSVLGKLGCSSRVELTASVAGQLGQGPGGTR